MGEAKRRKEAGTYPERRPSGPGRPVPHDGQWYWLEADGHVYRLVRGARIQNMELRRAVHDAAAGRPESRIVRPQGADVLRMAAERR